MNNNKNNCNKLYSIFENYMNKLIKKLRHVKTMMKPYLGYEIRK